MIKYIDPLCGYVSSLLTCSVHLQLNSSCITSYLQVANRLRSYRQVIKAAALQTIPMALKLNTIGDDAIQQLLHRLNFIYPRNGQV